MPIHKFATEEGQETVCHEGARLVASTRQETYGPPHENMSCIAKLWSVFLGVEISAGQVAVLMILLKAARLRLGYHRDSIVDICGYARLAEMVDRIKEVS